MKRASLWVQAPPCSPFADPSTDCSDPSPANRAQVSTLQHGSQAHGRRHHGIGHGHPAAGRQVRCAMARLRAGTEDHRSANT